jgi:hypothetical protein
MPTIRLLLLITGSLRTSSISMCRTALARSSSSRQQWMPGVITSRAVVRRRSKLSCANPGGVPKPPPPPPPPRRHRKRGRGCNNPKSTPATAQSHSAILSASSMCCGSAGDVLYLTRVGVGGLCITQGPDVASHLKTGHKLGVRGRESQRLHATDTIFCWVRRPVFG